MPACTSQTDKVEKTNIIGSPAENPKPPMIRFSFFKNIEIL